ncbi:MAG: hypothetical protein WCH83_01205 [Alphaproteobacteria bacterium]
MKEAIMERISILAFESVARDFALGIMGVGGMVLSLGEDPVSFVKVTAIGLTLLAGFLGFRAYQASRRDIYESDVWINLQAHERPPLRVAEPMIAQAVVQSAGRLGMVSVRLALIAWALEVSLGLSSVFA